MSKYGVYSPTEQKYDLFQILILGVKFWPQVVDFEPLAANFITMNVSFRQFESPF